MDHRNSSYQNTILIAEIFGRIAIAASTALFLIDPLVILSQESSRNVQLAIVSVFITVLILLVSLSLRVSSFETMAVAAAYAAVLSVFVSNGPTEHRVEASQSLEQCWDESERYCAFFYWCEGGRMHFRDFNPHGPAATKAIIRGGGFAYNRLEAASACRHSGNLPTGRYNILFPPSTSTNTRIYCFS